jgi:hypothetical protein
MENIKQNITGCGIETEKERNDRLDNDPVMQIFVNFYVDFITNSTDEEFKDFVSQCNKSSERPVAIS